MNVEQRLPDTLEEARLDVVEKFAIYLTAEILLARQGDGFFDRKYWSNFLSTKTHWQDASNRFYILLHELAK